MTLIIRSKDISTETSMRKEKDFGKKLCLHPLRRTKSAGESFSEEIRRSLSDVDSLGDERDTGSSECSDYEEEDNFDLHAFKKDAAIRRMKMQSKENSCEEINPSDNNDFSNPLDPAIFGLLDDPGVLRFEVEYPTVMEDLCPQTFCLDEKLWSRGCLRLSSDNLVQETLNNNFTTFKTRMKQYSKSMDDLIVMNK